MPKITRTTTAAGRLTRQSRAVFGDVSNNGKSTAGAKKSAVARVTDAQPNRRRSSRILQGGNDGESTTTATSTALASDEDHQIEDSKPVSTIADDSPNEETTRPRRSSRSATTNTEDATLKPVAKKKAPPSKTSRASKEGQQQQQPPSEEEVATAPKPRATSRGRAAITKEGAPDATSSEQQAPTTRPTRARGRAAAKPESDPSTAPSAKLATRATSLGGTSKAASAKRNRGVDAPEEPTRKSSRTSKSSPKGLKPITKKAGRGPDFLEQDDFRLFRGNQGDTPFDPSKYTLAIAPADLCHEGHCEEVPDYITDMMQRFFDREDVTRPKPYLQLQPKLNKNMRSILIDWLVEVHMKFRLVPETLYLCVNIIDRYLERDVVERTKLQLVGITALLIACKYEEIYPPEVRDCCYICDHAYTRQEVLDMEANILKVLEYRMSVPTAYPFMCRFLHLVKATAIQKHAAFYYMERMLQEYSVLKSRASMIACACVSLAMNNPSILAEEGQEGMGVPVILLDYTGFKLLDVLTATKLICSKVNSTQITNSKRSLGAVKRKYEAEKFCRVSTDFEDPEMGHLPSSITEVLNCIA